MDYKIVIDAGRGGSDVGKTENGITEKDLNLQLSELMYQRFVDLGIPVAMSRTGDETIDPVDRVLHILNAFGNNKNVIVISNHTNFGNNKGTEVIYALRNNSTLSNLVLENLEEAGIPIQDAYQRRLPSDTSKDYYFIHRDTGVTEPIIIEYNVPNTVINNKEELNQQIETYVASIVRAISSYIGKTGVSGNTYTVKSGDSLWSIAKKFNTTVDEIKKLNNLTSNSLSIGQELKIPTKSETPTPPSNFYIVQKGDSLWSIAQKFNTTVDEIKRLNNLKNDILNIGDQLIVPGKTSSDNIYIVERGDSLWSIANKFNTTVDEIKKLNNLTSNSLSIGQVLKIPKSVENPPSESPTYIVQKGDSLYTIARKFNTTVDELMKLNNLKTNLLDIGQVLYVPNKIEENTYTVKSGDSLWSIAQKFNTTVDEIKRKNNLTNNLLSIGQILKV